MHSPGSWPHSPDPEEDAGFVYSRRQQLLWRLWLAICALLIVGSLVAWLLIITYPVGPVAGAAARSVSTSTLVSPAFLAPPVLAAHQAPPVVAIGRGMVWVNTNSHIYHYPSYRWYGTTVRGKYATEATALAEGNRAALNERRPPNFGEEIPTSRLR